MQAATPKIKHHAWETEGNESHVASAPCHARVNEKQLRSESQITMIRMEDEKKKEADDAKRKHTHVAIESKSLSMKRAIRSMVMAIGQPTQKKRR